MQNCPDCHQFEPCYPNLRVCAHCGLGKTEQVVTADDEQDYMSLGDHEVIKRGRYFEILYKRYFSRHREELTSLDIGCASGQFVDVFAEHGWKAHGLDAYQGFEADNKRYFSGTLSDFTTSQKFCAVTLIHSLEHMEDPVASLSAVRSLLHPKGLALVVVPNFSGIWSRQMGEDWFLLNTDHHFYHYTPKSLSHVAERAGFRINKLRTYSGYFSPSRVQSALARRRFYERGFGSVQPFRSAIFRLNTLMRPIINVVDDKLMNGAEIHLLISPQ